MALSNEKRRPAAGGCSVAARILLAAVAFVGEGR
jgi:hypothetical protein